jgi:predicted acylesterase/phospholipase RssA
MRTRDFRARTIAVVLTSIGCGACILKTDIIGSAFNGGALNSSTDPFRVPSDLAASRVERILEEELADGYFQQGPNGKVIDLVRQAAANVAQFRRAVVELNKPDKYTPPTPSASGSAELRDVRDVAKTLIYEVTPNSTTTIPPLCKPNPQADPRAASNQPISGIPDKSAIEAFVDGVRFKQALSRAATRIAALRIEGLVDDVAIDNGAAAGFQRTASYLQNRRWTRQEDHKTAGIAIQGGAATGIFSAGVVWVVLQLIDGWRTKMEQSGGGSASSPDIDFHLVSGTSTGAMVSVAVDRFSAAKTQQGRQREIRNVAKWFTCYSFTDLMCAQSTGITALVGGDSKVLQGVLVFDGIQKLLTNCVKPWMFTDPAELILNTTEFRSGRIFALSDQNELSTIDNVAQAAVASAQLPVIGQPVTGAPANHLPFDVPYDSRDPARTQPAFLDGGIRSELPILPLVRRGVERVLAVGSGPSLIDETKRMGNSLDVFSRFVDLDTGAVKETEIQYAQRLAESMRLAEIDACMNALAPEGPLVAICDGRVEKTPNPFCSRWNICHGDFANACTYLPGKDYAAVRDQEIKHSMAVQLEPFWSMTSIFIDKSSVDGLPGYDFSPGALRRLFRAGAEAARVRCIDLATLLGILPEHDYATPEQLRDVNLWCSGAMQDVNTTCAGHVEADAPFALRDCDKPAPDLNACPATEDPL